MAASRVRYEPNFRGLGKIMTSQAMAAMLTRHAQRGKQHAEAIAPVETGEYKASFRVSSSNRGAGRWADRAAAYLYNDSSHALAVEFTNGNRTLGITADVIENGQ